MKSIIKFFFLHYFAGKAMVGILSNEKIYDSIIRLSKSENPDDLDSEITKTLVSVSYRYARAMANKI